MDAQPKIETLANQAYMGRRVVMPMSDFAAAVPALTAEVADWLKARGVEPTGEPLLRYHVIDMPERMDVEVGLPVEAALDGDGDIAPGVIPAGRYATLIYVGVDNGIAANKRLIDWIDAQGEEVVHHPSANGEAFKARLERFLTDARSQPDQARWETRIEIKLRD